MAGSVILVEGASDRRAVEVVADLRGTDLGAAGVEVVAMGGITNLPRHLAAQPAAARVTGLYDAPQRDYVDKTLARLGRDWAFFGCDEDLEDELIRALGVERVRGVIEEAGDLASYESLCRQPFHRDRPPEVVLRRFMGTTSGRKLKYAGLLAAALEPEGVPGPLSRVLDTATG